MYHDFNILNNIFNFSYEHYHPQCSLSGFAASLKPEILNVVIVGLALYGVN